MAATARLVDIDWITPELAVGGAFAIAAAEQLARAHGVRRVVDLRAEACDEEAGLQRHGIVLLHLPTEDNCAVSPAMLRDGVAWVNQALDAGHKVLVHCQHGIGRSALLALCVLTSRGVAPLDALERAKSARRVVSPSPAQLEAFMAFVREAGGPRDTAPLPTFDALAAIAYRHLR